MEGGTPAPAGDPVASSAPVVASDPKTGDAPAASSPVCRPFPMTFAEPPTGEAFASSYDPTPRGNYAFLDPGDEHLFVGGGALNGAIGKLLLKEAGQPIAFEVDAEGKFVTAMDPGVGREVPVYKQEECVYRRLHSLLFAKARASLNTLVMTSTAEEIGDAPVEFAAARVYSESDHPFGAGFLNIFKSDKRPFKCPQNVALLYTVGPLGRNKKAEGEGEVTAEREKLVKSDKEDFLLEIYRTGNNIMQMVIDYNLAETGHPPLQIVRFPIVSGGTFIHPEVTPVDVALALLWGLHAALSRAPDLKKCPAVELMPEKAMQEAYKLYSDGKKPSDWNTEELKFIFRKIPELS